VSRTYRNDVSQAAVDAFRDKIIIQKATGQHAPVVVIEGTTFVYTRKANLFLVAATKGNPNVAMLFEYLYQKLRILKSYLGENFDDETVRGNFTLLFELFDETMDYGNPQNCAIDVLKLYIKEGNVRTFESPQDSGTALTSQITGAIDWRRDGLRYRNNQVFIDVNETVSLLTASDGNVLRSEIHGKVMLNTQLTGMPECKFGLNDKLIMEKEGGGAATAVQQQGAGVEIDDCTFHRCVRLGKFDSERTITFIPPDGEFELMRYRVKSPSQPFRIISNLQEEGKTKLTLNIKVTANFATDNKAENVVIKVPMPPTAASALITAAKGRAKYVPGERAIVWNISSFPGQSETSLIAIVDLLPATREKTWVKPPISMDFKIPMLSASGVFVRFLKVYEKSSYKTTRWVQYLSKAGEYEVRL
jgi:AP-2 complex subunit mu-1